MCEIKEEVQSWENNDTNYKTRVNIVKTFIPFKLLFLVNIFLPPNKIIIQLNKQCVSLIWGTTREVTKRKFMCKSKEYCGLGAVELSDRLKIAFVKKTNLPPSPEMLFGLEIFQSGKREEAGRDLALIINYYTGLLLHNTNIYK